MMTIGQGMAEELKHEAISTRKALERVPDEKFEYTPHPKSMKMGQLASHIVELLSWVAPMLADDAWDIEPVDGSKYVPYMAKSTAELVEQFDQNLASAIEALQGISDEELMKIWSMKKAGEAMMSFPKVVAMRNFVLSHLVHHRAQLGVYLRLNDIPVPAMFGPSADEGSM